MARKTLTLHLCKEDLAEFRDALSEEAQSRLARPNTYSVPIADFGDGAHLFVFVSPENEPGWLRDLRNQFGVDIHLTTRSAAAVLIFQASGRTFASTFSHGWMYLDDRQIEGDFGLKVALNALDDAKLKRLERANLGDALRAVAQSPFQRQLASFGVDDALDLIRKMSGTTRDVATADTMTGSTSLKVSGEFGVDDLPAIATEALAFYLSLDYQKTPFKIVDWVMPVQDRRRAIALDNEAVASIKRADEDFELGLPIGIEDDVVEFGFIGPGLRKRHPDLLLRHYTDALGERLQQITPKTLRDHKIVASFLDDRPNKSTSIYSSLVGSIEFDGGRYAINEGEWYRVDDNFKASIERTFAEVVEDWEYPPLPLIKIFDAQGNGRLEAEYAYNTRFAQNAGYILLDTELIEVPGVERSAFEACDLLDIAGKRFIHVKKSSRKSTVLSHFFKQGANSAKQFNILPAAWDQLALLVERVAGQQAANDLAAARRDGRPWKTEYVIVDARRRNGEFNIPFFSKISLRDEISNLTSMHYNVGLKFIETIP